MKPATVKTAFQALRALTAEQERDELREKVKRLREALEELAAIGEGGVIERRETDKPTWNALDAIKSIARTALKETEDK